MVFSPNKVAFHPTLVYFAPLVDLSGVARDEKVRIQLKDLLLCREKELVWLLQEEPIASG